MRRFLLIAVSVVLLISITSCAAYDVIEFTGENGETYFYEYSEGIKTITNYHPCKLWEMPSYQEMIQYGDGAGLENEGAVYFIYVVDTSIDAEDSKAYYCAELDGSTKALICEDGEYFASEAEKSATVERLLNEMDTAYFK